MLANLLGILVVATYSFFNGAMFAIVENRRHAEEIAFSEAWRKEIEESQDSKTGRILMRTFYFIVEILVRLVPEKIYPISE